MTLEQRLEAYLEQSKGIKTKEDYQVVEKQYDGFYKEIGNYEGKAPNDDIDDYKVSLQAILNECDELQGSFRQAMTKGGQ